MTAVLIGERAGFFAGDWPQGFLPIPADQAVSWLDDAWARSRFESRSDAEQNPTWKQWIPYCVVRRCGSAGGPSASREVEALFVVQRTRAQGEARLHGAWSIGLGGHVEAEDAGPTSGSLAFDRALRRELAEELDFGERVPPRPRFLGLVNDDRTAVGRVHAGLVYVLDLPGRPGTDSPLRIREISKMRGGWTRLVELAELWQNPTRFESWSEALIRAGIAGPIGGCRTHRDCGPDG